MQFCGAPLTFFIFPLLLLGDTQLPLFFCVHVTVFWILSDDLLEFFHGGRGSYVYVYMYVIRMLCAHMYA